MPFFDLSPAIPFLHISVEHTYIPRPAESHAVFGAGFIFLGVMMAVESLAEGVWYRSSARVMFFPATLMLLGAGMLAVTVIEPDARFVHLAMGMPMAIGGWAEARVRLGGMRRLYADVLLVPALLLVSLETAAFHLSGPISSGVFLSHLGIVMMGGVIAGLRVYQSMQPSSLQRGLLLSAAVITVGFVLFLDGLAQPNV
ncbi:MAG: hypothetical protein ACE5JI_19525 [Acidobacteriota bacterium]